MQLSYEDEELQGVTLPLTKPLIRIGRAAHCDIVLRDHRVSRDHASIECLDRHYVLVDNGSSNGTFLNGLRITPQSAFVLREEDEIEIAPVRFRFGATGEHEVGLPLLAGKSGTSRSLDELLSQARTLVDPPAEQTAFLRAFAGLSRPQGLARSLAHVAERLSVDVAAIFVPHATRGIELVAAHPGRSAAAPLEELATEIMASDRGRLVRRRTSLSATALDETSHESTASSAAVPFCAGSMPVGVLTVEREGGPRLETADLARLAALGQVLGATLALDEGNEHDTRLGLEASLPHATRTTREE
jgi:pSer/pThr/pTyr-binding forkhead associated (FHA) protein